MTRYWKVLDADGRACHGGHFKYDLPKHGKPGKWTPRIKDIDPCRRGYHLCRDTDLVKWCNGATIWLAEARGVVVEADDKVVAESVRIVAPTPWDAVTARLFAVECAAEVADLMRESSLACLETAFRFALGDATAEELASARASAWDIASAWASAWDGAWDSARASAWDGARARASARDSARDSAWASAWASARARQTARLLWWIGASTQYPEETP